MKNILYLLSVIAVLLFSACEDYNDKNFEGLDDMTKPVYKPKLAYTMTDDDYKNFEATLKSAGASADLQGLAKKVGTNKYFTPLQSPKELLPYFLKSKYYSIDDNGTYAKVTYKYVTNSTEELATIETNNYVLSSSDYTAIWNGTTTFNSLAPNNDANKILPGLLKTKFPDAVKNDYAYAEYNYVDEIPAISENIVIAVDGTFPDNVDKEPIVAEGWVNKDTKGTYAWKANIYGGVTSAEANSYKSGEQNHIWLIIPKITLPTTATMTLFKFVLSTGRYTAAGLKILISTNFNGTDIESATWDDVSDNFTFPIPAPGKWENNVPMDLDLETYIGKQIHVAFKYEGDDSPTAAPKVTTTYQIKTIQVQYKDVVFGTTAQPQAVYTIWKNSGTSWEKTTTPVVQPADYVAIGAPGTAGCFSSSILAENYLPIFLAGKYQYPQEEQTTSVVYKYDTGDALIVKADEYQYLGGNWKANNIIEEQYVFNGMAWVFDPSINITMETADYKILIDWVTTNKPTYIDSRYPETTEYYFGANSKYLNFDFKFYNRRDNEKNDPDGILKGMTDEEALKKMWKQVDEALLIVLEKKYPEAKPKTADGTDMYYNVTYIVRDDAGVSSYYTSRYQCIAVGKFEFAEGHTLVE